jgi:hypothetical protein
MKKKAQSEYINTLLKKELLKWLPEQSRIAAAVDGLMLTRRDESSRPESCFYQPMIAIIVQG